MTFKEIAKNGEYVFEKISKDQMLEFVCDIEAGEKVYKKYLGLK